MITFNNIFCENITYFLKTLCIKNDYFASIIKQEYMLSNQLDSLADINNPYYLNICGEYAPGQSMIKVTSIETGEVIDFTKSNLNRDAKTKFTYSVNNPKFDELLNRYPGQEHLILSIRYPAIETQLLPYTKDTTILMEKLIARENYSILTYDSSLFFNNEEFSMVERLTQTMKLIRDRYDIPSFTYEFYYPHLMWINIWSCLFLSFVTQRVCNLRTSKTIPSQIWEFLTSKGLSNYRNVLTEKQSLFLYRNIEYLLKNKGKQGNLSYLYDKLLNESGVALCSIVVMQNSKGSAEDCVPTPEAIQEIYNTYSFPSNNLGRGVDTIGEIIEEEYKVGLEPINSASVIASQTASFSKKPQTATMTNLIDIQGSFTKDYYLNLKLRFILDTTLSLISESVIKYNIEVQAPDSDIKVLLTTGDAVALMYYCAMIQNPQIVLFTTENIQSYIGVSFDCDGETMTLTVDNKGKYLGKYVGILEPIQIPTSTYVNYAFKENLTVSMIPTTFSFRNITYEMSKFLDAQTVVDYFKNTKKSFSTPTEFTDYLNASLVNLIKYYGEMYSTMDRVRNRAFYIALHSLLNPRDIKFELVNRFTTYKAWFTAYPDLGRIISGFKTRANPAELYSAFSIKILETFLTNSTSNTLEFSTKKYGKIKELLIQLCSYTIGFISSKSKSTERFIFKNKKMLTLTKSIHKSPFFIHLPLWNFSSGSRSDGKVEINNLISFNPDRTTSQFNSTLVINLDRKIEIGSDNASVTYIPKQNKIKYKGKFYVNNI